MEFEVFTVLPKKSDVADWDWENTSVKAVRHMSGAEVGPTNLVHLMCVCVSMLVLNFVVSKLIKCLAVTVPRCNSCPN